MSNYWQICIEEALSELKIAATDEQIKELVEWVEGAHDHYGMAHGHDCIPNPTILENKKLKEDLQKEKEKVGCLECKGRGSITCGDYMRSSTSRCWKCNGEGKHAPY